MNRFLLLFLGAGISIPSFVLTCSTSFIFTSQLCRLKKFICLFLSSNLLFNSYLWKTCVILSFIHFISLIKQILLSVVIGFSWVVITCWYLTIMVWEWAFPIEFWWSSVLFWLFAGHVDYLRILAFFVFYVSSWVHVTLGYWNRFGIFLISSTNSMAWLVHIVSATAALFRLNTATQWWRSANFPSFHWFWMHLVLLVFTSVNLFKTNAVRNTFVWNQSLSLRVSRKRSFYLILYRLQTVLLISWSSLRTESFHQLRLNCTCLLRNIGGLRRMILKLLC